MGGQKSSKIVGHHLWMIPKASRYTDIESVINAVYVKTFTNPKKGNNYSFFEEKREAIK